MQEGREELKALLPKDLRDQIMDWHLELKRNDLMTQIMLKNDLTELSKAFLATHKKGAIYLTGRGIAAGPIACGPTSIF